MASSEFYQLSDLETRCFIVDAFVMSGIGILLNTYFLFVVKKKFKRIKERKKYSFTTLLCAVLSFSSSILVYVLKLLFSNDLLIPWNAFKSNQTAFISILDAIIIFFTTVQLLTLYYSFTFYSQLLFERRVMKASMQVFMVVFGAIFAAIASVYIMNDVLVYDTKEIGYAATDNFYVVMYLGHYNIEWSSWLISISIVNMVVYTIYLLSEYIQAVKECKGSPNIYMDDLEDGRMKGIKAIVLMMNLLVIFCVKATVLSLQLESGFLFANSLLIAQNLCLFFMFEGNERMYNNCCGCLCNNLWIKMLYGSKYQAVYFGTDDEEEEEEEEWSLNDH